MADKRTEYNRKWREANIDKHLEYQRQYREDNRDRRREANRTWHANRPRDEESRKKERARRKRYRSSHPDVMSAAYRRRRLRKFGLTPEGYDLLLSSQDGRCASCGTVEPGGRGPFKVDHDHATGDVRGLLCNNCNAGIGFFSDSPAKMLRAISYLKRHAQHRLIK